MNSQAAARQVEYIADATLDVGAYCTGAMYAEAFEHIDEYGSSEDMTALVSRLRSEMRSDTQPTPAQARRYAAAIVADGDRQLTDGGR